MRVSAQSLCPPLRFDRTHERLWQGTEEGSCSICATIHGLTRQRNLSPMPALLTFGTITAEMKKNGDAVYQVRGRDVIDDQIQAIAWLANHLAEYGHSLEAGQYIMTGSFTKPTPIAKGDTWETTFSGGRSGLGEFRLVLWSGG
jgi:hypothetical protein